STGTQGSSRLFLASSSPRPVSSFSSFSSSSRSACHSSCVPILCSVISCLLVRESAGLISIGTTVAKVEGADLRTGSHDAIERDRVWESLEARVLDMAEPERSVAGRLDDRFAREDLAGPRHVRDARSQ